MKLKSALLFIFFITYKTFALEIYPLISGEIISIKNVGDLVNKGDLLVQINDNEAKLELEHLQALQKIKQQSFDDVSLEFEQSQELYDRMVNSHRDLELARLAFENAKHQLQAYNIKIKIAKQRLKKHQIISPIKGKITSTPNLRNATNINNPKLIMVIE